MAVSAIVLADAQGTPVNHTFTPLGPDAAGVWWFEDQSTSTPAGYWRLSVQLKRPAPAKVGQRSDSSRVNRATIKFHMPTMETLGTNDAGIIPAPTVSYVDYATTEFVMAERDSSQNRKDLRKMHANLLANSQIVTLVESLINLYG
jgi:hypothetical protein